MGEVEQSVPCVLPFEQGPRVQLVGSELEDTTLRMGLASGQESKLLIDR